MGTTTPALPKEIYVVFCGGIEQPTTKMASPSRSFFQVDPGRFFEI